MDSIVLKKCIVLYCIRMLKILKKKKLKNLYCIVLYCIVLYCIRMLKVWKKKNEKNWNGIQCTTQYKFLNSIVPCIDFVVLCCLVGPEKVRTNISLAIQEK